MDIARKTCKWKQHVKYIVYSNRMNSEEQMAACVHTSASASLSVSAAFSELFFKRMSHGLWAIYTCVVVGWMRRRAFTDCHGDKIPVHVLAYTHVVEAKQNTTFF